MKFLGMIFTFVFAASAYAQVNLRPGETIEVMPYQRMTVSCNGPTQPIDPNRTCKMSGFGYFNGYNYSYRISQGNPVIYGSNDIQVTLNELARLTKNGICVVQRGNCVLPGSGVFAGYNYAYRISIDGIVVFGTNDSQTNMNIFSQFRSAGLCR